MVRGSKSCAPSSNPFARPRCIRCTHAYVAHAEQLYWRGSLSARRPTQTRPRPGVHDSRCQVVPSCMAPSYHLSSTCPGQSPPAVTHSTDLFHTPPFTRSCQRVQYRWVGADCTGPSKWVSGEGWPRMQLSCPPLLSPEEAFCLADACGR